MTKVSTHFTSKRQRDFYPRRRDYWTPENRRSRCAVQVSQKNDITITLNRYLNSAYDTAILRDGR